MDRIKSRDATGGDDAKCEIYCEMECAELKLVWTEEMSEVRQRQVRFLARVFRHNPLMYHTIRLLIRLHRPSAPTLQFSQRFISNLGGEPLRYGRVHDSNCMLHRNLRPQ